MLTRGSPNSATRRLTIMGPCSSPRSTLIRSACALGCAGPSEPTPCAACQFGSLDTGAAHATCWALGEATRGHNAVTALIHAAAHPVTTPLRPRRFLASSLAPTSTSSPPPSNSYTVVYLSLSSSSDSLLLLRSCLGTGMRFATRKPTKEGQET